MANEVPNAVTLLDDVTFRRWCLAGSAYQARKVVNEDPATADHATRLKLAQEVVNNPSAILEDMVSFVATDPSVCGVGSDVATITQPVFLTAVANAWTPLAKLRYPA